MKVKTKAKEKQVEVRYDEPIEAYHSNYEYLSTTALKHGLRSMKELRWFLDGKIPRKESPAFEIGKAFEMALIEPERAEKEVVVIDEDNRPERTKMMTSKLNQSWRKQFEIDNQDKIIVSKEDKTVIEQMVCSVRENYTMQALIDSCSDQLSVYWTDDETGVKLKTRPDLVDLKRNVIIDIKSIPDGSPDSFSRQVKNFSYWLQAIMQIDGIEKSGVCGGDIEYYWLVVEKQAPYNATFYRFDEHSIAKKWGEYRTLLEEVAKSQKTNSWGGYGTEGRALKEVDLIVY